MSCYDDRCTYNESTTHKNCTPHYFQTKCDNTRQKTTKGTSTRERSRSGNVRASLAPSGAMSRTTCPQHSCKTNNQEGEFRRSGSPHNGAQNNNQTLATTENCSGFRKSPGRASCGDDGLRPRAAFDRAENPMAGTICGPEEEFQRPSPSFQDAVGRLPDDTVAYALAPGIRGPLAQLRRTLLHQGPGAIFSTRLFCNVFEHRQVNGQNVPQVWSSCFEKGTAHTETTERCVPTVVSEADDGSGSQQHHSGQQSTGFVFPPHHVDSVLGNRSAVGGLHSASGIRPNSTGRPALHHDATRQGPQQRFHPTLHSHPTPVAFSGQRPLDFRATVSSQGSTFPVLARKHFGTAQQSSGANDHADHVDRRHNGGPKRQEGGIAGAGGDGSRFVGPASALPTHIQRNAASISELGGAKHRAHVHHRGHDDGDDASSSGSDDLATCSVASSIETTDEHHGEYLDIKKWLGNGLFVKKPSQVAFKPQHADLPLHLQFPNVDIIPWQQADDIIASVASQEDQQAWVMLTAIFRSPEAARVMFEHRDASLDVLGDSALLAGDNFQNDIDVMLAKGYCMKFEEHHQAHSSTNPELQNKVLCFAVIEAVKNRRRLIGWPRSLNSAERLLLKELGYKSKFSDLATLCSRARRRFFAQLDLTKYFQQFLLITRTFFTFTFRGRRYVLRTIPTGGSSCPVMAQILTTSCVRLAIRLASPSHQVDYDTIIDNIRLASDDFGSIMAVWTTLLEVFKSINCTVGDMTPPHDLCASNLSNDTVHYTFAGIRFEFNKVMLAQKTKNKLINHQDTLSAEGTTFVDVLSMFGVCLFASAVLDLPLAWIYWIVKFVRRSARSHDLSDNVTIWPSIKPLWLQWIKWLLEHGRHIHKEIDNDHLITAFVDASKVGHGMVIFGLDRIGTEKQLPRILIAGAKWNDQEVLLHINTLETLAIKKLAQLLMHVLGLTVESQASYIVLTFVDNTSAQAWCTKRRAPKFLANAIVKDMTMAPFSFKFQRVATGDNIADWPSRCNAFQNSVITKMAECLECVYHRTTSGPEPESRAD
jgi:hypothetical protein